MATGIVALLDDIAMLADDVAVHAQRAGTATAGILGDDVAVNASKATGFHQSRELKVIWEITKGSLKNKVIILPLAFILSMFLPIAVTIALVLGGFYLLFEGGEKIQEYIFTKLGIDHDHETELKASTPDNILDVEKAKIKSAILTDFILSIEIVIIAMSSVINETLPIQIASVTIVALAATFGVYGLVALIVRMDNVGFWLEDKGHYKSGNFFIQAMPVTIRILTVVGTVAMILVGGGIMVHNIPMFHHILELAPIGFHGMLGEFVIGGVIATLLIMTHNGFMWVKEKVGK